MAYVLITVGLILAYLDYLGGGNLVAAGNLVRAELFTNQNPYYKWLGALILVGLLGYIPEMRPIATAMLVLILLSILLSKSHTDGVNTLIKGL